MAKQIVANVILENEPGSEETVLTIYKEEDTLCLKYNETTLAVDTREFLQAILDVLLEEV